VQTDEDLFQSFGIPFFFFFLLLLVFFLPPKLPRTRRCPPSSDEGLPKKSYENAHNFIVQEDHYKEAFWAGYLEKIVFSGDRLDRLQLLKKKETNEDSF